MQKFKTKIIFPIFISHAGCPFQCIFCDQNHITNQSVGAMSSSPVKSEVAIEWDIIIPQVQKFVDKTNEYKEIAFFGGTFTCLSEKEMLAHFLKFKGVIDDNTYFRISTRPDAINSDILNFLKSQKVNTIELGIQSFSDKELSASKRGYDAVKAISACEQIKQYDFNLCVQLLIGLPQANNDTFNQSINSLKTLKPDYARLYPLIVLKDTILEQMYRKGDYKPLSIEEATEICATFYQMCDNYGINVIKMGLHGNISKDKIVAGPYHERFGELVKNLCLRNKEIRVCTKNS